MTKNAQSAPICLVVQFYWDKQQNLFRNVSFILDSMSFCVLCLVKGELPKKSFFYETSPLKVDRFSKSKKRGFFWRFPFIEALFKTRSV